MLFCYRNAMVERYRSAIHPKKKICQEEQQRWTQSKFVQRKVQRLLQRKHLPRSPEPRKSEQLCMKRLNLRIDPNDAKTSSTIDAMENLVFACSAVFHVCELINLSTATAVDMVVGKNTTENIVETTRQKEIKPIKSVSFTHQNHFMSQVSSIQSTENQTFRPSYLISSWRRRQLTLRRGSARNLTPTCQDLTK
jgi:hypothetical protein